MLDLSRVTLCIVDTLNHAFALEAINRSIADIQFGDVIFMTNLSFKGEFRIIQIPELKSIHEYNNIMLSNLFTTTTTDFVLVVQWDGFVVNPKAWQNSFFDYDYIGARWEDNH
eukprot:gene8507-11374_t